MNRLQSQLAAVGIALPELENIAATAAALSQISAPADVDLSKLDPKNIGKAVRDTATARLVAAEAEVVVRELSDRLDRQAHHVVRQNHSAIVETIKPQFAEAIGELAGSLSFLGANPNPRAVDSLPGAGIVSDRRKATLQKLAAIRGVRVLCTKEKQDVSWYLADATNLDTEQLEHARWLYGGTGHFCETLLAAGFGLQLNSDAEASALRQAVAVRTADAASRAQTAEKERLANDPQSKKLIESWRNVAAPKT